MLKKMGVMKSLFKREYSAKNMHKEIKENYEKGCKESLQIVTKEKNIHVIYLRMSKSTKWPYRDKESNLETVNFICY